MCETRFYSEPEREMRSLAAAFAHYARHFQAFHSTLSIAASEYKFLLASHFDDEHNFNIRIAGDLIRLKLSILRIDAQRMVGAINALGENGACRVQILFDQDGHALDSRSLAPLTHNGAPVEVFSEFAVNNFILNCIEPGGEEGTRI